MEEIKRQNKNEVNGDKSYNLNNVNHSNVGEVHYGDKIHQEIHDNSVNYEVEFPDITNIETLSIYLTTHFKEKNIGVVGGIGSVIFFVETPFFTYFISLDNLSIFPGNKFQVDLLSNSNSELA